MKPVSCPASYTDANVPLKVVEAVKALLGVRITTSNDLCLIESGLRPLSAIVKTRQRKFFQKMLEARSDMTDDPFMHVFGITGEMNTVMWRYIEGINGENDFVLEEIAEIKDSVTNQPPSATKFRTYLAMNPTLETHPLYTSNSPTLPDYLRINFTRYRLSSHRLRVEVGRWSRTPHDQRLCPCGIGVQDEMHVFHCPVVKDIFDSVDKNYASLSDIFADTTVEDLQVLYKVLNKLYETEHQLAE